MLSSLGFPACCRLCLKPTDEDQLDFIQCRQIHPESGFTVHNLLQEMSFEPSVNEPMLSEESICQACYCELENVYRFRSQCTEMNKFYKVLVEAKLTGSEEPLVELIERKTSDKLRSQLVSLGIISSDNLFMQSQTSVETENENDPNDNLNSTNDAQPPVEISMIESNEDSKDLDRPSAYNPKAVGWKNIAICPVPECQKPLEDQTYRTHLRECHKYGCKLCGLVLNGRDVMAQHVVIHKDLPLTVQCVFCNQNFPSFATMRSHAKLKHEKFATSYKCKECRVIFDCRKRFAEHINSHVATECNDCEEHFKDHAKYFYHMKAHHPEQLVRCRYCSQKFTSQCALDHHMELNSGNANHISDEYYEVLTIKSLQTFSCDKCDRQFSSEAYLSNHKDSHVFKQKRSKEKLDEQEYRFHCDKCNANFLRQISLYRHQKRKHEQTKEYVCDFCGGVFKHVTYLKNHIIYKHTKDFRYVCQFCKKAFATSSDLNRHRRIHTKECPYQCSHCGDQFTTNSSYSWHMRTNAGREVHRRTFRRETATDENKTAAAEIEQLDA